MRKNLLSLLLVLIIILSLTQSLAYSDDPGTQYTTSLTNIIGSALLEEPSDWEASKSNRAILAESLMLDLIVAEEDLYDKDLSNILDRYTQYKLEDGFFIRFGSKSSPTYGIEIPINGNALIISYYTEKENAFYTIIPSFSLTKDEMESVIEEGGYKYWEIDEDSIEEAFDFICNVMDIIFDE